MPHIPRDKFTRWNRSHSIPPLSLILRFPLDILRHAARFTVLLIRQRQLVSKDTLYINFGYCGGDPPEHPFSRAAVQPLPDSPVSLYCGFGYSKREGRELPIDSGQREVELSSGTSRAPSGLGKQDVEWVIEEGAGET